MRIMIKGGVWKNTEDEILKAAVMKYGKNQWARISSLLVRKSAKQCKARWYEWLDPSIKKTEWTREEDEKLLHLAKLMPTQWRTIAPIVGRTPSQCLERYEKLLDAACAKDENYEPNADPRKLQPGEIDPNPESKPARPDPVDMDEDEKEMLSEARARLSNTRGKKAKRKAREKQLEEARRLASLQKRRELKAAGLHNRNRRRKRKGIDYNLEIPFEKRPPPGFYDVSGEDRPVGMIKFPTTIEELEGRRRADVEAQLRKQDIAKNKIAQRHDAPSVIMHANKLNDPEAVRKRSKLMLPPPQISDRELEEIAKMGYTSDMVDDELTEGNRTTRTLLTNYSQTPRQGITPLMTPQRTPAGKADAIMMEAENLARLRESQTPLLGGENPELHPSDFSGVTPKKREMQTPNPLATPLATPGQMGLTPRSGMTPSKDGYSYGVTPTGTPFRDELHINEDVDMQDNAKLEQHRQSELKKTLHSGLTSLPQPRNEYDMAIQPIAEENEESEDAIEEDMSERIKKEKEKEEARQQALLRKRPKVLQRGLPRPPAASLELIRNAIDQEKKDKSSFVPPTLFEQADELINQELLSLLEHHNSKYPLENKAEKEKRKGVKRAANGKLLNDAPAFEEFEEHELEEADLLIKNEVDYLRVAMGHENEALDDFVKAHNACQEDLMYFPARNSYGLASVASNSDKLAALQNDFENIKKRMDEETKKATKLEHKIKILTHGHQAMSGKLWSQIEATYKQMDTAGTELECFKVLQKQEVFAASHRINNLVEEVKKQQELEKSLQNRYGTLLAEYDRSQRLLDDHKAQLKIQEEIAERNRIIEEERAAEIRALEEEIAERNRVLEEEMAERNRVLEEEVAERNRVLEEEMAERNRALEEEMAERNRVLEEEMAKRNRILEEESAEMIRAPEEETVVTDNVLEEEITDHALEEGTDAKSLSLDERKDPHLGEVLAEKDDALEEGKETKAPPLEEAVVPLEEKNVVNCNALEEGITDHALVEGTDAKGHALERRKDPPLGEDMAEKDDALEEGKETKAPPLEEEMVPLQEETVVKHTALEEIITGHALEEGTNAKGHALETRKDPHFEEGMAEKHDALEERKETKALPSEEEMVPANSPDEEEWILVNRIDASEAEAGSVFPEESTAKGPALEEEMVELDQNIPENLAERAAAATAEKMVEMNPNMDELRNKQSNAAGAIVPSETLLTHSSCLEVCATENSASTVMLDDVDPVQDQKTLENIPLDTKDNKLKIPAIEEGAVLSSSITGDEDVVMVDVHVTASQDCQPLLTMQADALMSETSRIVVQSDSQSHEDVNSVSNVVSIDPSPKGTDLDDPMASSGDPVPNSFTEAEKIDDPSN